MGIGKQVGKIAKKALLVAAVYGGKHIAARITERMVKAVSKKVK